MSVDWPEKSINELKATSKNAIAMGPFGSRIKAENFVISGVPIIKGGNLNGDFILEDKFSFLSEEKATELKTSNAFRKDIVITHRGTIGQVGIIPDNSKFERYVVSQSQLKVTLDENQANPYFVYYFLRSPLGQHRLLMNSSQVGVPAIAQASTSVKKIMVPCPDIAIQKKVVEILLNLDHKIELNRQTNQTLEQIAQALFKSWFVDFEPTRAKLKAKQNGQDPQRAAMAAISGKTLAELDDLSTAQQTQLNTTAALFPDTLVDSELGEIPEGWETKPFGELLSKTIGGDWGKEAPDEKHTEKVKILRGTDLPNVYAGSDDKVPTRYVDPKKLATRKLEAGDIVIEVSGGSPTQPTGRSLYLAQEIIERLNADLEPASFCRLFRPVDSEVGLILGLHLQKIYADGKTWLYQNTSTGISNFQTKVFLEKELVIIPSSPIKQHFYEQVMPYIQKMSNGENKVLAELRDTLLPKLLSGELSLAKKPTTMEQVA